MQSRVLQLLTLGLLSEGGLRWLLQEEACDQKHCTQTATCSDSKHWRLVLRSTKTHKKQVFHVNKVTYFDFQSGGNYLWQCRNWSYTLNILELSLKWTLTWLFDFRLHVVSGLHFILYYMGVGQTLFNSHFTLLAGARPMMDTEGDQTDVEISGDQHSGLDTAQDYQTPPTHCQHWLDPRYLPGPVAQKQPWMKTHL